MSCAKIYLTRKARELSELRKEQYNQIQEEKKTKNENDSDF